MNNVPHPTPPGTKAPGANGPALTVSKLSAAPAGPAYPNFKRNNGGWIGFGDQNDFPQQVVNISGKSPANKSIISSLATYICGKGVRDTIATVGGYVGTPNVKQSWDGIIKPIAKDYATFGGFYVQVILNRNSTTVAVYHQDFSEVRIGRISATGEPESFRISKNWKKTAGKDKPIELDVWPGIRNAKKGKQYIAYHWDYEPGLAFYCVPDWWAAEEYVKADGALGRFYNNSIKNGFTPSVVITMPSNPDPDAKAEFQTEMEDAFMGAEGDTGVVVVWGEDGEVKPTITPYNASQNADTYNNVETIVFQKIISAHRLSSPTLAGISGGGSLSGNAGEIIDSFVLYNYTVVDDKRRTILDFLNTFTRINGVADLVIQELDVVTKVRESEATAAQDTPEDAPAKLARNGNKLTRAIYALIDKLKSWK